LLLALVVVFFIQQTISGDFVTWNWFINPTDRRSLCR